MTALVDLLQSEPALAVAFANAFLLVLVNLGIPISSDLKLAIDTLLGAALAIAAGVVIRTQVTPVSKLPVLPPTPPAA